MLPLSVEALVSLLISLRPISLWGLLPLPEMGEFLIMGLKMTCLFLKLLCPTNNPTLLKRNNSQKSKRAKEQKSQVTVE